MFLKETLESILKQSFRDFEVVILDDGSSERADREICEIAVALPEPDQRIRYYRHRNQGPSITRNHLFFLARGKYILFFDDDDLLMPDMLSVLIAEVEAARELSIVYCGYQRIDENGIMTGVPKKVAHLPSGRITDALFRRIFISTSQALIPRKVLEDTGIRFHRELRCFEDTVFFLELSLRVPFLAVNRPLVRRRRHSANLSSGQNAVYQLNVFNWLYRKPEFAPQLTQRTVKERFAQLYSRVARETASPEQRLVFLKKSLRFQRNLKVSLRYRLCCIRSFFSKTTACKARFLVYCLWKELMMRERILPVRYYADPASAPLEPTNLGDDLNRTFLAELTGKEVLPYSYCLLTRWFRRPHYLCIGSLLHRFCRTDSVVWGSGMMRPFVIGRKKPARICAVRGPLTRAQMLDSGIDCPEIYGDPAILLPLIYHPSPDRKYRIGLIPHLSDLNNPVVQYYAGFQDVLLFDLKQYSSWRTFVDNLLSCEMILSSSLHGCILADAYGVPNLQVKFVSDLQWENFKFEDYHLSCRTFVPVPLELDYARYTVEELFAMKSGWVPPLYATDKLIDAAPFPLTVSSGELS